MQKFNIKSNLQNIQENVTLAVFKTVIELTLRIQTKATK